MSKLVYFKGLIFVCFLLLSHKLANAQCLEAGEVGFSSVGLSWTAPGDDGSVGTAAQYDLRYSLYPISEENWVDAIQVVDEPNPLEAGTCQSYVVNDLTPGTLYYFGIKTADEVPNWSVLSNIVEATTPLSQLIGGPFEFFVWNFNGDQFIDLGLRDLSNNTVYAAERDPESKRFIWNEEPVIIAFGSSTDQLLVGDYNNDGYEDLCLYVAAEGGWIVGLNQMPDERQILDDGYWLINWATGGIGGSHDWIPMSEDYSGDGFPDLCVYRPDQGRLVVAYNWGTYFSQASGIWLDGWGKGSYGTYLPFTGTLNSGLPGDVGMYHPGTGRFFPAMSKSPEPYFEKDGLWLDGWAKWSSSIQYRHFCGRIVPKPANLDDIIVGEISLGRWYAAENTGSSFVRKAGGSIGGSLLDNWPTSNSREDRQYELGDVSGDTYLDILSFDPMTGSVEVAYNFSSKNPAYFLPVQSFSGDSTWITDWGVDETTVSKIALTNDLKSESDSTESLAQNYPNPFNPTTTIGFSLGKESSVSLSIFNVLGQQIEKLVDQRLPAGKYSYEWDASRYASGVYFYRLIVDGDIQTKKMLLLK